MVGVVNVSTDLLSGVVTGVGRIALILQALGIIIVLWIIFQIINLILTKRRKRALVEISDRLDRIEKKIDKISDKSIKKK